MENELDTLITALYVKIDDDELGLARLPGRPPVLSHSELICLAVMIGFTVREVVHFHDFTQVAVHYVLGMAAILVMVVASAITQWRWR